MGGLKPAILFMLLFMWFIMIPATEWVTGWWDEIMPYPTWFRQIRHQGQVFFSRCIFPLILIVACVWMAFTTWQGEYGERTFQDLLDGKALSPPTNSPQRPLTSRSQLGVTNWDQPPPTNWGQVIVTNFSSPSATK
jgi:hypothetical protein